MCHSILYIWLVFQEEGAMCESDFVICKVQLENFKVHAMFQTKIKNKNLEVSHDQ